MSTTLSKIIMVIALSCLGSSRSGWGLSMLAEFKVATAEGRPLPFSLHCLIIALREMPTHAEGRMTLARYGLVLGIILPLAAMLFTGALAGYPFIDLPNIFSVQTHAGINWAPVGVNDGNRFSVNTLAFLILLLSARHVLVCWFVLERDWVRAAAVQRFGAAVVMTLIGFTGLIMLELTSVILPAAAFAIELIAVTALARWHDGAWQPSSSTIKDEPNYHLK